MQSFIILHKSKTGGRNKERKSQSSYELCCLHPGGPSVGRRVSLALWLLRLQAHSLYLQKKKKKKSSLLVFTPAFDIHLSLLWCYIQLSTQCSASGVWTGRQAQTYPKNHLALAARMRQMELCARWKQTGHACYHRFIMRARAYVRETAGTIPRPKRRVMHVKDVHTLGVPGKRREKGRKRDHQVARKECAACDRPASERACDDGELGMQQQRGRRAQPRPGAAACTPTTRMECARRTVLIERKQGETQSPKPRPSV